MNIFKIITNGEETRGLFFSQEEAKKYIASLNNYSGAFDENVSLHKIVECEVEEYALCEGRHEGLPSNFIFSNSLEFNLSELEKTARAFAVENRDEEDYHPVRIVYVTGFTPALTSLLKEAEQYWSQLVLMHWNKELNSYVPQIMWQ